MTMSNQTIDREVNVFFAGRKMTMGEFLEAYGLQDESDSVAMIVVEKLVKKGKLRILEPEQGANEAFKAVHKELDLEAKLAQMEEDADKAASYSALKNKEGKLCYEEIELDFPTRGYANDMLAYCKKKLKLAGSIEEREGLFVVVLNDVSESDLSAIKRHNLFNKAGKLMFETTDKVAASVIDTVSFASEKVVLPVTKAGISATLGLAKTLVKTTASTGSAVISGTSKNVRAMSNELAHDEDVLRAKKDLVDAKDAVMRLFKRGNKSNDIRITK